MRKLLFLLAFLVLAAPVLSHAQQKPVHRIAILEFDPVTAEAQKENLGRLSAEFLVTAAVNSSSFAVVERAAIKKVLDEMQFGHGNDAPATAAQAIGSMVGAQGVLTGSVAKTGSSVRMDARLIDVATGNIVAARSAYAKSDLRSMATAAELLISQLEGDLSRLTPPAPEPKKEAVPSATDAKSGEAAKTKENQPDVQKDAPAAPPAQQQQ